MDYLCLIPHEARDFLTLRLCSDVVGVIAKHLNSLYLSEHKGRFSSVIQSIDYITISTLCRPSTFIAGTGLIDGESRWIMHDLDDMDRIEECQNKYDEILDEARHTLLMNMSNITAVYMRKVITKRPSGRDFRSRIKIYEGSPGCYININLTHLACLDAHTSRIRYF